MGSFLGFGNFEKPGKGVRKDEPLKNRFFLFFELYFRRFWKLMWLNLLYMVACIPLVTFGPATTALLKLTSDIVERRPVFIWHDFWKTFGKNFKSSFFMGIFELLALAGVGYAIIFFTINMDVGGWFIYFGFFIAIVLILIVVFTFFHTWLLSAKVELKTFALMKNALILSAMSIKGNIIIFLFLAVFGFLFYFLSPFSFLVLPFFPMSTLAFMISYLYFPYVYMHVIKPYYDYTGEEDPYAPPVEDDDEYEYVYEDAEGNIIEVPAEKEEETLFTDAPELETSKQAASKKTAKKSIQ